MKKEPQTHIKTIRIYSQDIGMDFSVEKCTLRKMKRKKKDSVEEMEI